MSFIYLASPYSANPELLHKQALKATAVFIARGHIVYSPIVHCHPVHLVENMPKTFDFWKRHNFGILSKANKLWVLTLEGYDTSTGVAAEIAHAKECQIPVLYVPNPCPRDL